VPTNDGASADLVEAAAHHHPTVHEKFSWKIALA
jgi:hypothetical protein